MKIKIYIEIENEIILVDEIDNRVKDIPDDWYCLQGSIEIVDEQGDIFVSREDKTDIIPLIYELYSLFLSLSVYLESDFHNSLPHVLSGKVSTTTSLYHPKLSQVSFIKMNDVYFTFTMVFLNQDIKHAHFEPKDFYEHLKSEFGQFYNAINILYPKLKISMLDEIENIFKTYLNL